MTIMKKTQNRYMFLKKNLAKGWILRKYAHEGDTSDGYDCYWDEHILVKHGAEKILCADWEWAERDKTMWFGHRNIMGENPLDNQELLHDFNSYKF